MSAQTSDGVIAVTFEVQPAAGHRETYLDLAAELRPLLDRIPGFLSIERFASLTTPGKILSLSFWSDEAAVREWRNVEAHRAAQHAGRSGVFADYRLRVAAVLRDYGSTAREQAPADSRLAHDTQAERAPVEGASAACAAGPETNGRGGAAGPFPVPGALSAHEQPCKADGARRPATRR